MLLHSRSHLPLHFEACFLFLGSYLLLNYSKLCEKMLKEILLNYSILILSGFAANIVKIKTLNRIRGK